MNCCDEHEQDQWCSDPPRREGVPPERLPAYNCGDQSQRQSNISKANMNLLAISDPTFPIFETLLVSFDHQHSLRIHEAFRAWDLHGGASSIVWEPPFARSPQSFCHFVDLHPEHP